MRRREPSRSARALASLAVGALAVAGACAVSGPPDPEPTSAEVASAERAARLYAAHCAVCHGEHGAGDGPAADLLFPPARDFTQGRFRLVSTDNGVPSDEDLVTTLARGVPGTAMPAWSWLGAEDLAALADYVRGLAVDGIALRLERESPDDPPEESAAEATARTTPGASLGIVRAPAANAALLERGRALYDTHCAACHAPDGTGVPRPRYDEDGSLNWARDLRAGFLKGGTTAAAIADRIRAGLPGSAMPPTPLADDDLRALVGYVKTLVPDGADEYLLHRRERVLAPRVARLPQGGADEVWGAADATGVVLAPLRWSDGAVLSATVDAVHDGERIALRVRWPDATGERRVFSESTRSDAVALQFSRDAHPPLFGMGSAERPTHLWHWRAVRFEDNAGALDVRAAPHTFEGTGSTDVPLYHPEFSEPVVSGDAEGATAAGVGELRAVADDPAIAVDARWADGAWEVVFQRDLASPAGPETSLPIGAEVQLALAIWNGAAGDRGGQKSISIWQSLVLAR